MTYGGRMAYNVPPLDIPALVSAMEARGMSKTELARRSGVSLSHIKYLCRGLRGLHPRTARGLADALGVPVDHLYLATDDAA